MLLHSALIYLVLFPSTVLSLNNLLRDLLQDYPSQPNCDLQYVTDQSSKFNSLFSTTFGNENSFRALTLQMLTEDSEIPEAILSRVYIKCVMVFIDVNPLLAIDFIRYIHSEEILDKNHFYAVKLESIDILAKRNITEIYDFSHLVFLVSKVTSLLRKFFCSNNIIP